jgi:D-3-phosphoglycerate dehydrogenase
MTIKVLISTESFGECGAEPLQMLLRENIEPVLNPFGRKLTQDEVIRLGKDCIGIIAGVEPLNDKVLKALPFLRCISRCGVGLDNIDLESARKLGIVVTNTPHGPTRAVAELTVGVILDMLRNISFHDRMTRSGNWQIKAGSLLLGKRVGILGLGNIGKTVAELLLALGAEVAGTEILPDLEWHWVYQVSLLTLEQLLEESEILSLHLSYRPENKHLIGEKEIKSMKEGAYLVNMSRGDVVDEDALYMALSGGHLAGAALDVFKEEPYSGPLTKLNNVVITPHIGSYARESRLEMEKQAVKNLLISSSQRSARCTK